MKNSALTDLVRTDGKTETQEANWVEVFRERNEGDKW